MVRWGIFFSFEWLSVTEKKIRIAKAVGGKRILRFCFRNTTFVNVVNPSCYGLSIGSHWRELSRTSSIDFRRLVVIPENDQTWCRPNAPTKALAAGHPRMMLGTLHFLQLSFTNLVTSMLCGVNIRLRKARALGKKSFLMVIPQRKPRKRNSSCFDLPSIVMVPNTGTTSTCLVPAMLDTRMNIERLTSQLTAYSTTILMPPKQVNSRRSGRSTLRSRSAICDTVHVDGVRDRSGVFNHNCNAQCKSTSGTPQLLTRCVFDNNATVEYSA